MSFTPKIGNSIKITVPGMYLGTVGRVVEKVNPIRYRVIIGNGSSLFVNLGDFEKFEPQTRLYTPKHRKWNIGGPDGITP